MECNLRGIFQEHFEAYAKRHRLPAYVHRAAYWIARCRTAQLGGHLRRCPEGHSERAFYNSCHQRICPQCQGLAAERWLERQRARLLNCAHHHLIFTIPHELNALWCWNRASMAKLLFATVREVLFELLGDANQGMMSSALPRIYVLAGVNGAGKSSIGAASAAQPFATSEATISIPTAGASLRVAGI